MPRTLLEVLRAKHPELIEQWLKENWDFKIHGPLSLNDAAVLSVDLVFGKTCPESTTTFDIEIV